MADIEKSLADGQLAASSAELYGVDIQRSAVVSQIKVVNTDSVTRTLNIQVSFAQPDGSDGTKRQITPKNLSLSSGELCNVLDNPIQLETGDRIFGDANGAAVVDFIITGYEEILS